MKPTVTYWIVSLNFSVRRRVKSSAVVVIGCIATALRATAIISLQPQKRNTCRIALCPFGCCVIKQVATGQSNVAKATSNPFPLDMQGWGPPI